MSVAAGGHQGDFARDAAGFVLAGGESRRMGKDKALLRFVDRPLIANAISILLDAGLSAAIAGARSDLAPFAPVVPDTEPGLGPLAGICSALASTPATFAVFLPVDLPLLPPSLLRYLLFHATVTGWAVTVPSIAAFTQTFPAVVHCSALPALQTALQAGHGGCLAAFREAARELGQSVCQLPCELLAQSGQVAHPDGLPPCFWFLNLNSPDNLQRAQALRRAGIA